MKPEMTQPSSRGSAPTPLEVYIEPTNRCNEFCTTCPRTFFRREPEADLDMRRFVRILDQFPGVRRVVLHGVGEPLLARDLPNMVAEANRRNAAVLFNTNALALHPKLQARLVEAGLDELRVSMDAADPRTYHLIRGVDGYAKAMRRTAEFCSYLKRLGATRPRVSMHFMAMRENLAQLPVALEKAASIGVQAITLQRLVYFGQGMASSEQSVMSAQIDQLMEECERTARRVGIELLGTGRLPPSSSVQPIDGERPWSGCNRPWRSTYVTANGNVLPCCIAPFSTQNYESIILGNVWEQPIAQIWNGEQYQVFRDTHRSDHPPEPCQGCGTRWMY
jgi:radical SAM protein with 4Fe4S-binding SPASM domain